MNETPDLEAVRQEHESWLAELEGLAVEAIATNDWTAFYAHVVDFQNEQDLHGESGFANIDDIDGEASADSLDNGPALTFSQPRTNERLGD
jgi:hypothetical protein